MIRIAVARITNLKGEVLLVRKVRTCAFMQPGGKLMAGEVAAEALRRELVEELALVVDPGALTYLGEAEAPAANEPGECVAASVFSLEYSGAVSPRAEIVEARWVDPSDPGAIILAPLTCDAILPWKVA